MNRGLAAACVFAGSSPGARPAYGQAAADLGHALATRGIRVVYGGASVGLMGRVADAALECGGEVIGVLPRALSRAEIAHDRLTELRLVDSMHERKAQMADLADRFIALPGGLGTFEELLEIVTWAQLGIHDKPCGILNVDGYFDGLLALLDHAVAERFVTPEHRAMLIVKTDVDHLLDRLDEYRPPRVDKWIDRDAR